MSNSFNLMETNPNVACGSNGCLCHELGGADTKGPFVVWASTETDNVYAPFPVLCAGCLGQAGEAMADAEMEGMKQRLSAPPASPRARRPTHAKRSVDDADGPSI